MSGELFDVSELVVIVTGASRGIGRAVAEGFAEHGARTVLVARSESLDEQVASYSNERVIGVRGDLGDPETPGRICRAACDRFGQIDVLVNNAAITLPGAAPYEDATWQAMIDVNLTGSFRMAREAAGSMRETGGGSIINVGSIAAVLGMPDNPAYQAAKGGLRQLTRAMARDFAADGIRVNCLCPGYILTDMTRASYEDPPRQAERSDRTLLGRWGDPSELVGPCLFLASPAASYITGTDLFVDGGWTAKGL